MKKRLKILTLASFILTLMSYGSAVFALDPSIVPHTFTSNSSVTGYTFDSSCVRSDHNSASWLYYLFDGITSTRFYMENATTCSVQLPAAKILTAFGIKSDLNADESPTEILIRGSNNGSSWTTLLDQSGIGWPLSTEVDYTVSNTNAYTYYSWNIVTSGSSYHYGALSELYFYGTDSGGGGGGGATFPTSTLPSWIGLPLLTMEATYTSSTIIASYFVNTTTQEMFNALTDKTQSNLLGGFFLFFLVTGGFIYYFAGKFKSVDKK